MTPAEGCAVISILLAAVNCVSVLNPFLHGQSLLTAPRHEVVAVAKWRGVLLLGTSMVLVLISLSLARS